MICNIFVMIRGLGPNLARIIPWFLMPGINLTKGSSTASKPDLEIQKFVSI